MVAYWTGSSRSLFLLYLNSLYHDLSSERSPVSRKVTTIEPTIDKMGKNKSGAKSNGSTPQPDAGPSTSPPPPPPADLPPTDSPEESTDNATRISQLEEELEVVRGEKESLGNQYRALLGKLTAMRQSLGDKLREDAVSLVIVYIVQS